MIGFLGGLIVGLVVGLYLGGRFLSVGRKVAG